MGEHILTPTARSQRSKGVGRLMVVIIEGYDLKPSNSVTGINTCTIPISFYMYLCNIPCINTLDTVQFMHYSITVVISMAHFKMHKHGTVIREIHDKHDEIRIQVSN